MAKRRTNEKTVRVLLSSAVLGLMGMCLYFAFVPQVYLDAEPDDVPLLDVPAEATEVYVMTTGLGPADYYEFSLSEEAFSEWAKREQWDLHELGRDRNVAETVPRRGAGPHRPQPFRTLAWPDEYVAVRHGYSVDHWWGGDSGWRLVYDVDRQRAYFSISRR